MARVPKGKSKAETQEGKCPESTGTPTYAEHSIPGLLIAEPEQPV